MKTSTEIIENLLEAIQPHKDWWPDDLTKAVKDAKAFLEQPESLVNKYSYFNNHNEAFPFTIIHKESDIETIIAITSDAEKADFISKSCNQFSMSQPQSKSVGDVSTEDIIKRNIPNGVVNIKAKGKGNGKPQYKAEIEVIKKCMKEYAQLNNSGEIIWKGEYDNACNEINDLQKQLKDAEEEIRFLQNELRAQ